MKPAFTRRIERLRERGARCAVPMLLVLAIAFAVFWSWMHLGVLDPLNVGWLIDGHDRGQNAVGFAAFLRDAPPWPSTRTTLLSAPEGLTLLFTDSNPALGLLLRPFASVLPAGVQVVGPWLLLCVVLQAAFAWALIRPRTTGPLPAPIGTFLLTAMPVLVNRYGHPNLCAQWMILAALWLFLDPRRSHRPGWWALLLGTAALVHSNMLVLVAAVWGGAVLRALAVEPRRGRTLAGAAAAFGVAAALVWAQGGGDGYESTNSYGLYTMPLDALWNPANASFSALLPSRPDTGARFYEGFQYLGAGLLLLCLAAPLALVARARAEGVEAPAANGPAPLRRLLWLVPTLGVFAVLAIGNDWIWRGEHIFSFPLSDEALRLLDPIRSSGRLFWPTTYVVALVAIVLAARLRHGDVWLSVAAMLQAYDIGPMLRGVRAVTAVADAPRTFRRTLDPRWRALVEQAGSVAFYPSAWSDMAVQQEVQWRAILACRPVRFANAARLSRATRMRLDAEASELAEGRLDPTRLYVLTEAPPAAVAGRVRLLDGIAVIPPSAPAPPPRRCAGRA